MAIAVDDRELVLAHQAGDPDAFREIVRTYEPRLTAAARHRLRCHAAAEDAVQQTFTNAYRHLGRFNGQYQLGPWLNRILINVCHDEGNRRRRESEKSERVIYSRGTPEFESSPETLLELDSDHSELHAAFAQLQPKYREALYWRAVDGLNYDEIAERADITEDNARARVSRASRAMRAALKALAVLPALGALVPLLGQLSAGAALAIAVLVPTADSAPTQVVDVDGSQAVATLFPEPASVNQQPAPAEPLPAAPQPAAPQPAAQANAVAPAPGAATDTYRVVTDGAASATPAASGAAAETETAPASGGEPSSGSTSSATVIDGTTTDSTTESSTTTDETTDTTTDSTTDSTTESSTTTDETTDTTNSTDDTSSTETAIDPLGAGVPSLAPGTAFNLTARNLAVIPQGPNRVGISGAARLDGAGAPPGVEVGTASRISVGAASTDSGSGATQHPLTAAFSVPLGDGTVLEIAIRGVAQHTEHPSRATDGIQLQVSGAFASQVRVLPGSPTVPADAAALSGSGTFSGTLEVSLREGTSAFALRFAS